LTLREEYTLKVLKYRVLRRIFGPEKDEVKEGGRNCITRSFAICALCQVHKDELEEARSTNGERRKA
jgi:hypothetical protein